MSDMTIDTILLVILLVAGIWTVVTVTLLRSAMGLIFVSVLLSIIMYRLDSPIAAVFELSVCAGLISVIFISTISLTQRLTPEKLLSREREVLRKYWFLPLLLIIAGIVLSQINLMGDYKPITAAADKDVREVLWNFRHLDLLGQGVILLTGTIGVVILFKETRKGDR